MSCLWLTRPEADSASLAAELKTHGIESCIAPLAVEPSTEAPDALLVTSRHAVHTLDAAWKHLPVFCVGSATAEAVRAAGFNPVQAGEGDLLSLLPAIMGTLKPGANLRYLSGFDIQLDPTPLLAAKQITCTRVIAYDAVAEATLPSFLRMRLAAGDVSGVTFFSARSAQIACNLLREEKLDYMAAQMTAYCLSLPVAQAAGALPWRAIQVSHLPTRASFVAMLAGRIAS